MTDDPLPAERLSPLATLVDEVLAGVGYEVAAAIDTIDDAVPGYGGLFDPATTSSELHGIQEKAHDFSRGMNPSLLKQTTTT